ncbi:MAG TPA: hypothetical protein VHT24_02190, partial [Pseudacidobacterium sp.]|nr:hypothetical protein [Pseudacidobacterium sp.]
SGYPAVAGYDLVTGWGSPDGSSLINALAGTVSPTFTLSTGVCCVTVKQGSSGLGWITVNRMNGFTGRVSLSASGLPGGVTVTFNPASVWGTSTLTFTASSSAYVETVPVTITGVDSSKETATIWLTITK